LDNGGVFTDTAEFVHLIPECTNISVGYLSQHSSKETQDINFVERLRDTLIHTQWHEIELPITRKPEPPSYYSSWDYGYGYGAIYEDYIFSSVDEIEQTIKSKSSKEVAMMIKDMAEYIDMLEQQGFM
jgi:hypothetical protein